MKHYWIVSACAVVSAGILAGGGCNIVVTSSSNAIATAPGRSAYTAAKRGLVEKLRRIGPCARVEVAIHQKLRERKEAERHRIRLHLPTPLSGHSFCNGFRIP